MKKTLYIIFFFPLCILIAPHWSFAQDNTAAATGQSVATCSGQFCAIAPIPGLTDTKTTSVLGNSSFSVFFNNLYKYLVGIAAILAVIMIIWSGIDIALNRDSVSKAISAKGRIGNAIFGLVLVLSPVLVFSIINPSILSLSLNIPDLKVAHTFSELQTGTESVGTPCKKSNGEQGISEGSKGCIGGSGGSASESITFGKLYPCSGEVCRSYENDCEQANGTYKLTDRGLVCESSSSGK